MGSKRGPLRRGAPVTLQKTWQQALLRVWGRDLIAIAMLGGNSAIHVKVYITY